MTNTQTNWIQVLSDDFHYPQQVIDHISEIVALVVNRLGESRIRSIILFGSTSRGELTYETSASDALDIYSDYEFLVITKSRVREREKHDLASRLDQLPASWGISNPLFHVEYGINSETSWRVKGLLRRNIANFETVEAGITLWGDEIRRNQWSTIRANNLDLGNTNDLVVERLAKQFTLLKIHIDSMPDGGVRREILVYYTLRNVLEILTVFLPNEGHLGAGYVARHDLFVRRYQQFAGFANGFPELLELAMAAKLHARLDGEVDRLHEGLLVGYLCLVSYLLHGAESLEQGIADLDELALELSESGQRLFPDPLQWRMKRILSNFRVAKSLAIDRPVVWAVKERRQILLGLLLYANEWALNELRGIEQRDEAMENIQRLCLSLGIPKASCADWPAFVNSIAEVLRIWRPTTLGILRQDAIAHA